MLFRSPDDADPDVVSLVRLGRSFSAVDAKRMEIARTAVWNRVTSVLGSADVIVCPTMSVPPGPAAKADHMVTRGDSAADGLLHSEDMTTVWNLVSPLPVVSVPCGVQRVDGIDLPVGMQIVGRPGREDVVLTLAEWVEQRSGMEGRQPKD